MICSACGHENRAAAKFCEECAAPLARSCPQCGAIVRPAAKLCDACGGALGVATADKTETRKVVTIVFADLIGSTSLHERLDPESVSRVMDRYHRAVRAPVEAHRGTVVQLLGDGVMCAFGVPRVAEDDAIRAVRAAVGIQEAFREFAREHAELVAGTGLRVAVNTGEVVVSDDYAAGIGDPLNVAARLQQEARDGDVLIGEATRRLVGDRLTLEPFGVFRLKGRTESVAAYRVVSLERPAGVPATAFVGRDDELRRLLELYETAVAARRAGMAVILGSPGLGKSRLIDEISRRLGDRSTVLTAHCDAASGATFAPIAEVLRGLVRDDDASDEARRAAIEVLLSPHDPERARIAAGVAALLGSEPAPPEETFFVVRRFLASLANTRPVVLAIDDVQWAEPLLLDLIEHLAQWSTGSPLFVLVAARPELREVRSSLAQVGGLAGEVVTLGGLDAAAATRLAANVIGADALPAAVAGRVLATSEGNPLFVGELVRMLVHDGALKREGERWTAAAGLADLEMPPTIQALLAARIERVAAEDRTVLERAAVIGAQFSRPALAHLLPAELRGQLDARLEALRRSELIEPDTTWFLGEPALRFHHGLTRDAAYRRVLKGTRAELHARFAGWIESRAREARDVLEHDETIGWHLEQAHQNLRELGPIDAHGRALGERAARHLGAAGRRALARDDLPLAASLIGRAIDRLDVSDAARADLALDWCEALLAAGEVARARSAIDELGRWTEGARGEGRRTREGGSDVVLPSPLTRLRSWHTCFAGQLAVLSDPQALRHTADALSTAAEEFAVLGDDAGEAKAHSVHALALSRLGRIGACEAALDKALAAARRGRDRRRANTVLAGAPLAALWGPSPVTRASGRCLDVVRMLRITQGAPGVEAVALRCQAVLEALRGRADAARRMIDSSRRMVEELGITQGLLETEMFAGLIELFEGNIAAAEQSLRAAYEGLRGHGLGIDAARAAALLGRALLAQGGAAEAEALSQASETLAGDDLQAAITWRQVRAEAMARRGEHAAAVELARAAVAIAATTDALLHHADARQALAAALHAADRHEEAAAEERRAIELWRAKGASVLAERAGGRVARLDLEAEERAIGRFEELARNTEGERPLGVRENAATANAARSDAAVPARDVESAPSAVPGPARPHIENAATRWADRFKDAWNAHDWERVVAGFAAGFRMVDGRKMVRLELDHAGTVESLRLMFDMRSSRFTAQVLATRGERLALHRWRFAGFGHRIGPMEVEYVQVTETDERGDSVAMVMLDPDDLDATCAELDRRYAAGEAAPYARALAALQHMQSAATARDWEEWAAGFAVDALIEDHRSLGWDTLHSRDEYAAYVRTLVDLAPDVTVRFDHVLALDERGVLLIVRWVGTREGGAFEMPIVVVTAVGRDGLIYRLHAFDLDSLDEGRARFEELGETER